MGFVVAYDRVGNPEALALACFDDLDLGLSAPVEAVEAVKRKEFEGKLGQVVEAFPAQGPRLFVVGLGSREQASAESVRQAGLALARRVRDSKAGSLHFQFPSFASSESYGEALGAAFGLAGFTTKTYAGSGTVNGGEWELKLAALDESLGKGLVRGLAVAAGVNEARRLINTPPNVATPDWMASEAEAMAEASGLGYRVIRGEELEAENLVGLVTVGKASVNKPCLIRLEWRPEGTEGQAPVVLLGKTITYDTGGLSLKSKDGMAGMKYDKSGGCAVFGAMKAIAEVVKPPFPVVGLLVAAENSVSDVSYRPDDVMTYRNGVTVEVTNTDAEGRLVLADGLIWAEEVEKAKCVVNLATLTGGVVTALGSVYAGAFSRSDSFFEGVREAAEATGELIWRLPLHPKYDESMVSTVADIVNSVPGGKAHPVQGATFLSRFITDKTDWVHLDIAGVSRQRANGVVDEGPTGFGVRLLVEWVSRG